MRTGTKLYLGESKRTGQHIWRLRAWDGTRQITETFKAPPGANTGIRAADRALTALVRRVESGGTTEAITLRQLAERWLRGLEGRRSPLTVRDYRNKLELIMAELGETTRVDRIRPIELDDFYDKQGEHLSPATVLKYHRILSSMFRQAEKWDLLSESPARNATPPSLVRGTTFTPSVSLVKELVEACLDDRMRLLILFAASLGARRGELCALRWEDIDVDKSTVTIKHSAYEPTGGGVVLKETKTDKGRVVSIDPQALRALAGIVGEGFIFSDDGKAPWRPDHVTKEFAKVRAKVPAAKGVRLHSLRHFHATQLVAAGYDAVTVSKRLGHANVTTTLNIYSWALDERDRAASNAIGELLSGD